MLEKLGSILCTMFVGSVVIYQAVVKKRSQNLLWIRSRNTCHSFTCHNLDLHTGWLVWKSLVSEYKYYPRCFLGYFQLNQHKNVALYYTDMSVRLMLANRESASNPSAVV